MVDEVLRDVKTFYGGRIEHLLGLVFRVNAEEKKISKVLTLIYKRALKGARLTVPQE